MEFERRHSVRDRRVTVEVDMEQTACPSWASEASPLSEIPKEDTLADGREQESWLKEHFLLGHYKAAQKPNSALEKLVSQELAVPEMAEAA